MTQNFMNALNTYFKFIYDRVRIPPSPPKAQKPPILGGFIFIYTFFTRFYLIFELLVLLHEDKGENMFPKLLIFLNALIVLQFLVY